MRRIVLILALLACDGGPAGSGATESWPYAVAQRDCAPWDGAATSVHLTNEPLISGGSSHIPMLRLSVYHDIGGVRGARWPLGDSGPDGAVAVYCTSEPACESATSGWIQFESGPAAGSLDGRYDVVFPDGVRRAGEFRAPVQEFQALCG